MAFVLEETPKRYVIEGESETFDPTEGMSAADKFRAGLGKRMMDIGTLGLRQTEKADGRLMQEGWAQAGGVGADLIGMLGGGALLKGAGAIANAPKLVSAGKALMMPNTLPKAVASGALYGAATDSGGIENRLESGAFGAAGGALFPAFGAVAKGGKALVEPLTKRGQEKIAARVLQQFGGDDLVRANPAQYVRGSVPTTAEAVGNEGLSTLAQGLRNNSPEFANALAERNAANRAARVSAVQSVAGNDADMLAAESMRDRVSSPLYDAAKKSVVQADGRLKMLLSKPSLSSAWTRAERLAAENGETLSIGKNAPASQVPTGVLDANGNQIMQNVPEQFAKYSGKGLHYLKMALDDMLDDPVSSMGKNEKRALMQTKNDLLAWMDTNIPEYGQARSAYSSLSKPINQMEIGQMLYNKLQSGLAQMGANTRENAATYANALRDADALAEKVTGIKGVKAADVLTIDQMTKLKGVGFDLARKAKSDDLARGLGSNTAKNLSTQNLLRQAFGPLGMPQSWAESTMLQTLSKPLNIVYGNIAEPRIADALGKGLLDTGEAQRLMRGITPNSYAPALGYSPLFGIAYGAQQ
jgi:hypothetical protein